MITTVKNEATFIQKIASFVSKAAPLLGTALGGPAAGMAVSLLASAFGGPINDAEDLLNAISGDPDAMIKLKELELKHQEALLQMQVTAFASEVSDRDSARKMQIENKSMVPHILAFSFMLIYASIQYCVITNPGAADDIISARVQDIMILIMSFYFGGMFKRL